MTVRIPCNAGGQGTDRPVRTDRYFAGGPPPLDDELERSHQPPRGSTSRATAGGGGPRPRAAGIAGQLTARPGADSRAAPRGASARAAGGAAVVLGSPIAARGVVFRRRGRWRRTVGRENGIIEPARNRRSRPRRRAGRTTAEEGPEARVGRRDLSRSTWPMVGLPRNRSRKRPVAGQDPDRPFPGADWARRRGGPGRTPGLQPSEGSRRSPVLVVELGEVRDEGHVLERTGRQARRPPFRSACRQLSSPGRSSRTPEARSW